MNMKCACGYIYKQGFDDDGDFKVLEGGKPFIDVNLTATISQDYPHYITNIYACPKCGTLKIEI